MGAFKPEQRHLELQGRRLHFVSYEGQPANTRKGEDAQPPMWYLMVNGRRFPAFPCDPKQESALVDQELLRWAEANAVGPAALHTEPGPQKPNLNNGRRRNWWGPE